jgi:hypothetical protein
MFFNAQKRGVRTPPLPRNPPQTYQRFTTHLHPKFPQPPSKTAAKSGFFGSSTTPEKG